MRADTGCKSSLSLMQADIGCEPYLSLIGKPACVLVILNAANPCNAHKALQEGRICSIFSLHAQDATKAFKKLITEKEDIDGLPESALALAAQQVTFAHRMVAVTVPGVPFVACVCLH